MTAKKNAINISIIVIAFSALIIALCWNYKDGKIAELLYVLSTGVFASGFVTLWVFVYEYNHEKNILLKSIFHNTVDIIESPNLYSLAIIGFHDSGVKEFMKGKHYTPSVFSDTLARMDKFERCHYELCRFVDAILDIGYEKINHANRLIDDIDFWSDTFRKKDSKLSNIISSKIGLPLYETFIFAPGMQYGYLFRFFNGFKFNHVYDAEKIYPLVAELDNILNFGETSRKYSWQDSSCPHSLKSYMHEKLWIFRDAFYSSDVSRKQRRKAKDAFLNGTFYPWIR